MSQLSDVISLFSQIITKVNGLRKWRTQIAKKIKIFFGRQRYLLFSCDAGLAMQFPAKITSSCIWAAILVD